MTLTIQSLRAVRPTLGWYARAFRREGDKAFGAGQSTGVSMLSLYDPDMEKEATPQMNKDHARSITAKIGVIAAYFHRARCGEPLPPVRRDLSEAAHFLYLMTGKEPSKEASADSRRTANPIPKP